MDFPYGVICRNISLIPIFFKKYRNSDKMYSLMDAGNFMWGVWSAYIGLTNAEVWAGSNINEFPNFDSEADQQAIKDGRKIIK